MGNYLIDFKEKLTLTEIKSLLSPDTCPFLFYNMAPYIITLAKGGWFDWVKKKRDSSYRKAVNSGDFKKREINRLYPNEVLVRCPNPAVSVVAGIGLWPEEKIKIRILSSCESCANGYKCGDEIVVDRADSCRKALDLSSLFPAALTQSYRGALPIDSCEIDKRLSVGISRTIFPCRYHKEKSASRIELLPDGFCPHAFSAIYPYILAKMYNAKVDNILSIRHPGKEGRVTFMLEKIYRIRNEFVRRCWNLLKMAFEIFFHPVDAIDYELRIKVLENESEGCPLKRKRDYRVNLKDEYFLCPASFYTLYPYLLLASSGHGMRWSEDKRDSTLPCPDCAGMIYSIKKAEGSH